MHGEEEEVGRRVTQWRGAPQRPRVLGRLVVSRRVSGIPDAANALARLDALQMITGGHHLESVERPVEVIIDGGSPRAPGRLVALCLRGSVRLHTSRCKQDRPPTWLPHGNIHV